MNFIISKEEYLNAITAWNKILNRNSSDHIIYNMIRGHNPNRGFSPIQSPNKLNNGAKPWQSFEQAKSATRFSLRDASGLRNDTSARTALRELDFKDRRDALSKKFGITFTPELIAKLKEVLA